MLAGGHAAAFQAGVVSAVGDAVADDEEDNARDTGIHEVLGEGVDHARFADHAAFQHGETRLHEEDEEARQQDPGHIQVVLDGGAGSQGVIDGHGDDFDCFGLFGRGIVLSDGVEAKAVKHQQTDENG